jgi:multidrug efflux system membrane fusion protein
VRSTEAAVQSAISGVESAKAGIQSAQARIAEAEKDIERLTIKAPFEGLLESDSAELGSLMQPGSLCATVIQLDPIKVIGFVPETAVNRVEVGALAKADLTSGLQVQGRVTFLSRSADPETRTFLVEIDVPNADLSIRDGQTAEIVIGAEGQKAHFLPQSVLTLNDEGKMGVRLVDAGSTALFLPVTLMRDTVDGVWLSGLPDQADVILVGQEFVIDGVPVAPTYQEAKP